MSDFLFNFLKLLGFNRNFVRGSVDDPMENCEMPSQWILNEFFAIYHALRLAFQHLQPDSCLKLNQILAKTLNL